MTEPPKAAKTLVKVLSMAFVPAFMQGHIRVSYFALGRGGERAFTKINGCWPHVRKV
jgi:hypothetical protein